MPQCTLHPLNRGREDTKAKIIIDMHKLMNEMNITSLQGESVARKRKREEEERKRQKERERETNVLLVVVSCKSLVLLDSHHETR